MRYTNGGTAFSSIREAPLTPPPALSAAPAALVFLAGAGEGDPEAQTLSLIRSGCTSFDWQASDDAAWLQTQASGDRLTAGVSQAGLDIGVYTATVTIQAMGIGGVAPAQVPVRLLVVEVERVYLPLIRR